MHPEAIIPSLRNRKANQTCLQASRQVDLGGECRQVWPATSRQPSHAMEGWRRMFLSIGKVQVRPGVSTLPRAGLGILFKCNRCFHRIWRETAAQSTFWVSQCSRSSH